MRVGLSQVLLINAAILAATAGCAAGADEDRAAANDGPPTVVSIQSQAAYDSLPVMRLRDLGPLCRENADVCVMRGFPVAAVSESGDVLFIGSSDRQLQVYRVDSLTARAVPVGRNGGGPGEYRVPGLLAIDSDGSALVGSLPERRLLRYAPDGASAATSVVPLPAGSFAFGFVGSEVRVLATALADERGDSMPVDAFALDVGARKPRRLFATGLRTGAFAMSDLRPVPLPFAPRPEWVIRNDGGFIHSTGDRLVFDAYSATGRHEYRVGFDVSPREVTADELAESRAPSMRGVRDPRMREALEAYMSREGAKYHPAITSIVDMGGDRIWVRESPMATTDSVSWVIFDLQGGAHGRVLTGEDDRVFAAHGEAILMSTDLDADSPGSFRWMTLERP